MKNNIVYTVNNTVYQVTQDGASPNKYWFYRREIHDKNDMRDVAKTLVQRQRRYKTERYDFLIMGLSFLYWCMVYAAFFIFDMFPLSALIILNIVPFLFIVFFIVRSYIEKSDHPVDRKEYKTLLFKLKNMKSFPFVEKDTYHKTLGNSYEVGKLTINNPECNLLDVLLDPYQQVAFAQIFDLFAQDDLPESQHERLEEAISNYLKKYIDQQKYIMKEEPYSNLVDLILQDSKKGILIDNSKHEQ